MKRFWILWSPYSHLPPTTMFRTKGEAKVAARVMAKRHGGLFYICQAKGFGRRVGNDSLNRVDVSSIKKGT